MLNRPTSGCPHKGVQSMGPNDSRIVRLWELCHPRYDGEVIPSTKHSQGFMSHDRFLSCDWSSTKMSINMKNAPTNCTDLVRERKNRFRTCYPQRTSKPAAILASSLPLTWRSVYRLCRRKEGSPTESSNSAI